MVGEGGVIGHGGLLGVFALTRTMRGSGHV